MGLISTCKIKSKGVGQECPTHTSSGPMHLGRRTAEGGCPYMFCGALTIHESLGWGDVVGGGLVEPSGEGVQEYRGSEHCDGEE
jgi:hypothetical protein